MSVADSSRKQKQAWGWTEVSCTLKTSNFEKKSSMYKLAQSVVFTNPSQSEEDPIVQLFVDTEKSLTFSEDLGWNWHKSWNLPNLLIRFKIVDAKSHEDLLTPRNLFAKLFAVKKNGQYSLFDDRTTLIDVGIRGQSLKEMVDGQATFNSMKFDSTSYNHEGQNFHILIVIYLKEEGSERPKVVTSLISPQIFVDSRKSARELEMKRPNLFIEPFHPDNLEKEFIKRESRTQTETQILIKNDAEGLYNYLTAPNIRHKVKHPIFLSIRFSTVISLSYNSEQIPIYPNIPHEAHLKHLFEVLQRKLSKEGPNNNNHKVVSNFKEKQKIDSYFVLHIHDVEDSLQKKKIMELLENLQIEALQLVYGNVMIPECYKDIKEEGNVSKAYRERYESLRLISRQLKYPEDDDSDEEESSRQKKRSKHYRGVKPKPATRVSENEERFAVQKQQIQLKRGQEMIKREEVEVENSEKNESEGKLMRLKVENNFGFETLNLGIGSHTSHMNQNMGNISQNLMINPSGNGTLNNLVSELNLYKILLMEAANQNQYLKKVATMHYTSSFMQENPFRHQKSQEANSTLQSLDKKKREQCHVDGDRVKYENKERLW